MKTREQMTITHLFRIFQQIREFLSFGNVFKTPYHKPQARWVHGVTKKDIWEDKKKKTWILLENYHVLVGGDKTTTGKSGNYGKD